MKTSKEVCTLTVPTHTHTYPHRSAREGRLKLALCKFGKLLLCSDTIRTPACMLSEDIFISCGNQPYIHTCRHADRMELHIAVQTKTCSVCRDMHASQKHLNVTTHQHRRKKHFDVEKKQKTIFWSSLYLPDIPGAGVRMVPPEGDSGQWSPFFSLTGSVSKP